MNEPDKQVTTNQSPLLEDLTCQQDQAEAVKGGDGNTPTAGQFPWQVSLRTA